MNKKTGKRTASRGQKSSQKPKLEPVVVTASQVRNLVADELQDRNRPEIASSYTGHPPEHRDLHSKPSLNDKEPILDIVAANKNKVLHDPSKEPPRSTVAGAARRQPRPGIATAAGGAVTRVPTPGSQGAQDRQLGSEQVSKPGRRCARRSIRVAPGC